MHFKKMAGVAVGALVILGSAPAVASNIDSYKDGQVHAYSYGTNTRVAVSDTKKDGHPVYVNYRRDFSSEIYSLWNKSGEGTTQTSGSGNAVYTLRACVNIDGWPDKCDSWR
ncbi:hypothetical protein [Streptomyces erythrochromogenes]|uniref:hypothetical protein n=1 Tax=Streptomyces erythrochromogenes TaxID=285574 RepID=UPI0036A043A6